ncbi:AraC family transcriptional regulator [Flavobacterium sp. YO12]|uniref:helix-turn-helix domain-containing protein n=1 Tax=unclassified Flavobacterium TaxID=196869 RepID=UPI00100B4302|nr:AraC family transcriptional regulator [Flavobacterium sp. YO12]RXM43545.1 hypothetical protein BOW55_19070 [Flavobacterium sp. YO12]
MSQLLQEFKHTYSLTSDWRQSFVDGLGCTIVNENMYFPEEIATGSSCFSEILPDVSVVLIDCVINKPLRFTRVPFEDDFWIVYYDLSDSISKHIVDDVNHTTGYKSKLNFAIVDNKINSSYLSTVGERFYAIRLLIRKSYLKTFFNDAEFEKDFKDVFDNKKKKMFFYGHIDSRSKVVLNALKQQQINNLNYEFLLKGAAYNLLAYLIERLNTKMPSMGTHLEKDIEAVMLSQQHLLSNLLIPFPGIEFLANIANMSPTKYRSLYSSIFGMSPPLFFKIEKLLLAKELLESGSFKLISDVAYELGYNKTTYFSSIYKDYFGVLPNTVRK